MISPADYLKADIISDCSYGNVLVHPRRVNEFQLSAGRAGTIKVDTRSQKDYNKDYNIVIMKNAPVRSCHGKGIPHIVIMKINCSYLAISPFSSIFQHYFGDNRDNDNSG